MYPRELFINNLKFEFMTRGTKKIRKPHFSDGRFSDGISTCHGCQIRNNKTLIQMSTWHKNQIRTNIKCSRKPRGREMCLRSYPKKMIFRIDPRKSISRIDTCYSSARMSTCLVSDPKRIASRIDRDIEMYCRIRERSQIFFLLN